MARQPETSCTCCSHHARAAGTSHHDLALGRLPGPLADGGGPLTSSRQAMERRRVSLVLAPISPPSASPAARTAAQPPGLPAAVRRRARPPAPRRWTTPPTPLRAAAPTPPRPARPARRRTRPQQRAGSLTSTPVSRPASSASARRPLSGRSSPTCGRHSRPETGRFRKARCATASSPRISSSGWRSRSRGSKLSRRSSTRRRSNGAMLSAGFTTSRCAPPQPAGPRSCLLPLLPAGAAGR